MRGRYPSSSTWNVKDKLAVGRSISARLFSGQCSIACRLSISRAVTTGIGHLEVGPGEDSERAFEEGLEVEVE